MRRTRLRWYQFGLGTLLFGVTLCAVALSYWRTHHVRRAAELAAIVKMEGPGATIEQASVAPRWLRNLLGGARLDDFMYVQHVGLSSCHVDTSVIEALHSFGKLESLSLFATTVDGKPVTDAHLKLFVDALGALQSLNLERTAVRDVQSLEPLHQLKELNLCSSQITDAGLEAVPSLRRIEHLDISDTRITGKGLRAVAHLPRLQRLELDITRTSGGLRPLAQMKKLRHLSLLRCQLTDDDMSRLGDLPELEVLNLCDEGITDQACEYFARLPRLRFLRLSGTKVGDEGLRVLGKLQHLEYLDLVETRITDEGIKWVAQYPAIVGVRAGRCRLTERGLLHLLAAPPSLKYVDFEQNNIDGVIEGKFQNRRPNVVLGEGLGCPEELRPKSACLQ